MPKTVSATEAKNRLGSLIGWVLEHRDEVIVESRGEPAVVIMSASEYESYKALKEQARRRRVFAELEKLRQEVSARNQDLTPEEADALADRFVRDVIADMVEEGKLRFAS